MEGIGKSSKQGGVTTREPKISIANLVIEALVPDTNETGSLSTEFSKNEAAVKMRKALKYNARKTQKILGNISEGHAADIMSRMGSLKEFKKYQARKKVG